MAADDEAKRLLTITSASEQVANTLHVIYDSFLKAGFSSEQAFELTKMQYENMQKLSNERVFAVIRK